MSILDLPLRLFLVAGITSIVNINIITIIVSIVEDAVVGVVVVVAVAVDIEGFTRSSVLRALGIVVVAKTQCCECNHRSPYLVSLES